MTITARVATYRIKLASHLTERLPHFVASLVVASAVLFFYKTTLLLETETIGYASVKHFVSDGLTAVLLSVAVLIGERLRAALLYGAVILYVVSIHTVVAFGGFVDVVALSYIDGLPDMGDNIHLALRWYLLLSAPLVMFISWWGQHRLRAALARVRRWVLWTAGGAFIASVLLLSATPLPLRGELEHQNPIGYLLSSVAFHLGERLEEPSGDAAFSPLSPYPSPAPVAPVITRVGHAPLNVVVVLLESTGAVTLGRDTRRAMPHFWRLAERGVYFENAYANLPNSMKSIFALHTGQDPAADWSDITETRPRIPLACLPAFFKTAGYRTALLHGGHFSFYRKDLFLADRGYDLLYDGHNLPNRDAYENTSWGIDDRAIFDFARGWLRQDQLPFLLTLIPVLPHSPYVPPKGRLSLVEVTDQRTWYLTSIEYIDGLLGELIDDLDQQGRLDDTLFLVVGDHGEAFGQHPGNIVHSKEIYEENIRVPMLIATPRLFATAQRSRTITKLGDVLPTLLDLAGIDAAGYGGDGVSLLRPQSKRMVFFYTGLGTEKIGLRDGDFKYIYRRGPDRSELYDLNADPGEQLNIAPAHIARIAFYKRQVRLWKSHTRRLTASVGR